MKKQRLERKDRMANVQVEDGCTKIANSLLEALEKIRMSDCEHRILYSIFRRTYGENKKFGWITPTLIHEVTQIDAPSVSRGLRSLEKRNMIVYMWMKGKKYIGIQKDYDLWGTSIKSLENTDLFNKLTPIIEDGSYRDITKEEYMKIVGEVMKDDKSK